MKNKLVLLESEFGTKIQQDSVALRDRILRKPLGLQFSEEDLRKEVTDHHLVCMEGGNVIGVILMRPVDANVIKMRQVAIDEHCQRKGIGTLLVDFAEKFSKDMGYKRIEMHARKKAVPFYERLNYFIEGEVFYEVGIPHFSMFKLIG